MLEVFFYTFKLFISIIKKIFFLIIVPLKIQATNNFEKLFSSLLTKIVIKNLKI